MEAAALHIRLERPSDAQPIGRLIQSAFAGHPHSAGTEPLIVERLRAAGALTLSLVAEEAGHVLGHVAVSPVRISDGAGGWFGVGPVSVVPARQRAGIGTTLMRQALAQLAERGAAGCVVLGDPAYYGRFGFVALPGLVYPGPPPECFMARCLGPSRPSGTVAYHPAFDGPV